MREISFFSAELALAGLWLALRAALALIRGRVDWKREALLLLMYVNLAVILRFAFFPMRRAAGQVQPLLFDPAAIWPPRVNLVPFRQLFHYASKRDLLLNVIGNAAMFIPTGILLPILDRRLDSFWKVVGAGALMSLCIELAQLPFAVRASDADDLLLNTLGVALGYGIYSLCTRGRRGREKT